MDEENDSLQSNNNHIQDENLGDELQKAVFIDKDILPQKPGEDGLEISAENETPFGDDVKRKSSVGDDVKRESSDSDNADEYDKVINDQLNQQNLFDELNQLPIG